MIRLALPPTSLRLSPTGLLIQSTRIQERLPTRSENIMPLSLEPHLPTAPPDILAKRYRWTESTTTRSPESLKSFAHQTLSPSRLGFIAPLTRQDQKRPQSTTSTTSCSLKHLTPTTTIWKSAQQEVLLNFSWIRQTPVEFNRS